MVNINLTLVIELVLFLIFLWGTSRFILGPALKTMDGREAKIEQDRAGAESASEAAQRLEAEYGEAIGKARLEGEDALRDSTSRALDAQTTTLSQARRELHDLIARTREQGRTMLATQREELQRAAPAVAEELKRRLGLEVRGQ